MKSVLLTVTVALLLAVGAALAGPLDEADTAHQRGDYATALKVYRLLAEQGNAHAQVRLGMMYATGEGGTQDLAEAVKLYRLSAAQGDAEAEFIVGGLYENGQRLRQDYVVAAEWYRLSAEQGYAPAQWALGMMHITGRGVPHDNVRAHMWFNLCGAGGVVEGEKMREEVAKSMTPPQIAEAQQLARECHQRDFKDCD